MYYSINPEEIKTEIEKLGHTVTNIWNTKHYIIKLPFPMFFVELKPAPNNKGIFNVEYMQQYKIKFELPKLQTVQIVKDMGTSTIIAHSNRDVSDV
jgi:hypothetical protein